MKHVENQKKYTISDFSPTRRLLGDYYEIAGGFHRVMGLAEHDITDGRKRISELKEQGYNISLTSWVAKCVAKAVSEDKRFNTFHKGKRKTITFEDVDISVMVEIPKKDGEKVPYNHCIRNVDKKSIKEINEEIRAVQQKKIEEHEQLSRDSSKRNTRLYMIIPTFIRRIAMRIMLRNPFYINKLMGTVGISTMGETAKGISGWAVGFGDKTLNLFLGGIVKRVVETEKGFESREFYCITYLFDHSLVDGVPMTSLVARVNELIIEMYGIRDIDEI